ncbi:hypothetical protein P4V64_23700, partial [Bacillus thuringiensis]|nr:hypothetical protein [Bacillus thuringiensis]
MIRLALAEEYNRAIQCFKDKICPSCSQQFEKTVTRKRSCLICKETIVVRTHYKAKQKMLLMEAQIGVYEKESRKYYAERHLERLMENKGLTKALEEGKKEQPNYSSFDIAWGLLNQLGLDYAAKTQWGLFRNTRLTMAEILNAEEKWKQGLAMLLEVCYYDLNGASNVATFNDTVDKELLRKYPPFRPKDHGFLAPGVLSMVESNMDKLQYDYEQVKNLFVENNAQVQNSLMPISPEKAWKQLEKRLQERRSVHTQSSNKRG